MGLRKRPQNSEGKSVDCPTSLSSLTAGGTNVSARNRVVLRLSPGCIVPYAAEIVEQK